MIAVQLLGGACMRSGDTPITGPPAQRHRIALLSLVVAAWPQPLSRDRAMAMLWPERDLAGARRLLNLAVHVLRSALGEGAIASAGDGLLLNPSQVRCDLHDLRIAIAADDAERVVRLYTGPVLDGFHLPDSSEFGYWLDERRNELAHAYVGALLSLANRQEHSKDVHGRVGTARRLVAVDPHSSVYAQTLMKALAAAGDLAAVDHHALEHANRRRVDLDLEPDPNVVALARQLRMIPATDQPKSISIAAVRTSSVAVLPFINLSSNAENEYFADGITEDVIAHLSKIRALKVISRTSVMRFKQRQHTLREIGATLGVTTILDGSVRHSGDHVRIVAKLIDVEADQHLWVETFDRQMTDIFSIQTEVALQIASALEAELSPEEQTRVRSAPTEDVPAYHLFLQGRQWLIKYTVDDLMRAVSHFDKAIARDPEFALAYANVAMAYIELAEIGVVAPEDTYARAATAAASAVRCNPELGEAHCALGYLKAFHEFDWAGSEESFKRALELNPNSADTYDLYGRLCAALERYDESITLLSRAQELDPLAHRVDVATTLLRAGRFEEAVRAAENAVELDPFDRALATLGWAYFFSGRQDEGIVHLERAATARPGSTVWLAQLGEAYGLAGNLPKARGILRTLQNRSRTMYVSPYHFAYVHTGLGNADEAMDWLERAMIERAGPVYAIKGSFLLAPLRSHPKFRALLREMNLD